MLKKESILHKSWVTKKERNKSNSVGGRFLHLEVTKTPKQIGDGKFPK